MSLICSNYDIDYNLAISIVFPEMIRYSHVSNFLETKSLEVVYVRLGRKYSDFSIGFMQMKPSFAEDLEMYLQRSDYLKIKYQFMYKYNNTNEKLIRQDRITRLQNFDWQTFYLSAFCDVLTERFPKLTKLSIAEKLEFYASAYNLGFQSSESAINEHIQIKSFPYGKHLLVPQYAYCDVALDYYKNYCVKN